MTIPLPLRRILMASVLIPVSLSFSASAADFMVDAAQTSDPAHNIYTTLNDLASSGSLAAGDTVVLNNDDASLTTSLTVPVNFRSDDPDMPCTVDLSGLRNNPMYNLAEGEYTLDMDSVIWANGNRRVIQAQGGDISLEITGHVQFLNNSILSGTGLNAGGAIYMSGVHSIMVLGDRAIFHGNHAYSYGFNYDTSYGGAIYMSGNNSTIMTFGDHASFSDNYAYGSSDGAGGAIYMKGNNISLTIRNGASFTNNYAFVNGGAIFLDGNNTDTFSRFLAFTHDVLFSGNMTGGTFTQHDDGSFSVENGIANSIHVSGTNHLQLAAAQGREVRFNDPITSSAYSTVTLSLNQYTDDEGNSHATDGSVIFSGELYQGDDAHLAASRYSDFKGQTTLYGGALILEHNVVFGNASLRDDTSMTLEHGTLEITGGSVINAASFSITNSDVVLRPGTSAFINAKDVDLSHGFVFDMQKQAQEAATRADAGHGLSISASGSFLLGGSIGVMDTGTTADYFYADNSWAQQRTFIVLTDSEQAHTDDFSGAHSLATGSGQVDSPYAYTGSWSHQWVDADGDGFPEQLQLVWSPDEDAAIRDILPELAGALAMNSLWSSASNAQGMSTAALGNLDAPRFITGPENNYWVKGMGDFLNHASEGARDGFDYHGGGYSVGADRRITSHAILGLGFGDLYGRMRGRSFAGDIGQQTRIGMLYGGWYKNLDKNNALLVTGTAGYGWTDNKMNSSHTGNWSHGKWTNETLFGTFNGKWSRRVNGTLAVDFMLGLEYTDVTQEAFTETGWDARRFEKGHLKNLSVPVGVGFTHRSELKGREWIAGVSVSYVPDVYRENPAAQAERLLNGYRWEAKGTAPDRNAVRVNVNSSLQLNARWRTYAGCEFEGRSKATAHRFNAGVSYAY
ncbi:autotransporter outer membrane beta-barrel domain-containing protein [Akkermansia muciniphila]|nr:autotransporter outer membrane beta-barrel domain-containing protein [Akkermansia muciniphila]